MYESVSAEQKNAPIPAVDPVVTKAAEYFAMTAKYEAPKVDTFPLRGVGCAGITSLTGNI
jgi:hypothetical protein